MLIKFIKVLCSRDHYVRGRDSLGQAVRHTLGAQLYRTAAVELTAEERSGLTRETGAELREAILDESQLCELNRLPTPLHATLVTVELKKPQDGGTKPLDSMKKAELQERATELGLDFEEKTTVKELIAMIEGKQAETE